MHIALKALSIACVSLALTGSAHRAPASAAMLTPDFQLKGAYNPSALGEVPVHKVHRSRRGWHCESRWDRSRGWHWHRRACRGDERGYRDAPRRHRGHKRHDRKGCWFHPRRGLHCEF